MLESKERFKFYALQLVGVMILVFVIQLFSESFTDYLLLDSSVPFQVWRYITSIFLHGGFGYLLSNMFALALFGSLLERFIGGKKFLLVFFVSGVLANIVSINFYSLSLGASGAIFGVLGALTVLRPMMMVWAAGVPVPMFVAGIFWALADITGFFDSSSSVANVAHLSGMFFGLVFGAYYRIKDFRNPKRGYRVVLHEPSIRAWEDRYMR